MAVHCMFCNTSVPQRLTVKVELKVVIYHIIVLLQREVIKPAQAELSLFYEVKCVQINYNTEMMKLMTAKKYYSSAFQFAWST